MTKTNVPRQDVNTRTVQDPAGVVHGSVVLDDFITGTSVCSTFCGQDFPHPFERQLDRTRWWFVRKPLDCPKCDHDKRQWYGAERQGVA